jgi:spore germination cell wall hydrolase CwlJ-like protein
MLRRLGLVALLLLATEVGASTQVRCMADTVYGEARGESEIGQALVAQTILNRATASRWPASLCGVVRQPRQFDGYPAPRPRNSIDLTAWSRAYEVSRAVRAGGFRLGECGTATHFHAVTVRPAWAASMQRLCRVDSHIFYREIP